MPDISMCLGGECPRRADCYRFRAKPSMLQSYFTEPPFKPATGVCSHFWPAERYPASYLRSVEDAETARDRFRQARGGAA
jgi:hypothetical protein